MGAGGTDKGARLPFVAFISDDAAMETTRQFAAAQGWPESCIHKGNIHTAADVLKTAPSPFVLLVDIPSQAEAGAALDKLADVCDPGVKVIATGTINEYSFYIWLTEIGISSYLLKPFTAEVLAAAYQKTVTPPPVAATTATDTKPEGKAIAFLGVRGGVGSSTLAAQVGYIIGNQFKQPTVLVDLDPQLGTSALMLDLDPGRGLRDALEKPERIDSLFIERVVVRVSKDFALLNAEEAVSEDIQFKEQAATVLLKELRTKYKYIIYDLPRVLNPLIRSVLKQADTVVLVSEMNLLSLRDTLRLSDYFRDTLKIPVPMVVANRQGLAAKVEMIRGDFEKGIGSKLAHVIPFNAEVMECAASGEPLTEKAKSAAATKAIVMLAQALCPDMSGAEAKAAAMPEKKSLFGFKGKK